MGIIYMAKNKLNGKFYIGKTVKSLDRRKYEHHTFITPKTLLQKAISKYGKDNFEWSILDTADTSKLNALEQEYISKLNSVAPNGYNLTLGGDGSAFGELNVSKRADVREKLRISSTGRKCSDTTKEKIRKSLTGRKLSDTHRKNIGLGSIGHVGSVGDKNSKSKEFLITFPDGLITNIKGLKEFCRNNNLDPKSMRRVARGEQDNHKGFKCKYV